MQGQIFLTAIDTTIKYRSATHLQNHTARELYAGLDRILRTYNNTEYWVGHIHCDREFKTILEKVCDDMDIQLHCPPAGAHVPEAERNICVIKERVRITNSHIPFKICPNVMAQMMVLNAVTQLNLVPAKGGVSEYYSPHMILKRPNLDLSKHCQFEFGTYVQANQDNNPTNTCLLYTSPSPRDGATSRMPSSA